MFNILSHQGNANQHDTEIPPHPTQNGHHQENKHQMLVRMQMGWGCREGTLHTFVRKVNECRFYGN
jgi:hypothetical protein